MQRVLSTFFQRWQYRHPTPDDFFAVLNEVTGTDHDWFVEAVYRNSHTFDYAVERIESEPVSWRGLTESPQGPAFETQTLDKIFRTKVIARRLGSGQFPVDVLVTFADGHQERESWDGRARWQQFTFDRPVRAVSVQIDPERVLLLDTNFTNNSQALEPVGAQAATKWSLRWMVWLQDLFMTCAFLV
jgi:hypothetical protein